MNSWGYLRQKRERVRERGPLAHCSVCLKIAAPAPLPWAFRPRPLPAFAGRGEDLFVGSGRGARGALFPNGRRFEGGLAVLDVDAEANRAAVVLGDQGGLVVAQLLQELVARETHRRFTAIPLLGDEVVEDVAEVRF